MAEVTYDDRSLMIDGQRVWLVSGSIHYFRVPADLWADRLLKAKRAGLNCISTYVAWNFHEPAEGKWALEGDHDVVEFVRQADKLGLYVILRPGPYICAEWDGGGLPGWLTAKSGVALRTSSAAYMHYFDKYFAKMLPRLAELQVSKGGNVILIQNENEYGSTTMPDRLNYLTFINQLFRRSGFDVPIINCNMFSDPPVPENIECVNGWSDCVGQLKRMRLRRPDQPLLVTELWPGWYDTWGGAHHTRDDYESARRALEIVGCGAQYNYYMWHGGTNFGFWSGRSASAQDAYGTTSYDYDAPLAEGGGLTRKYYLTKLVNMLANHMGPQMASCAMEEPGVTACDSTAVLNMYGPSGRWAVVTNNGCDEITSARVSLPGGEAMEVSLEPLGAVAIPLDVRLTPDCRLDYANLMPLGLFDDKVLVLHGPPGFEARVSVNGKELATVVPAGDEPKPIEHEGLIVVVISTDLAQRTWLVDETIVFGPAFVGQSLDDIVHASGAKQCALMSMDGKVSHKKAKDAPAKKPAPPRLGQWTRKQVCTEPVSSDLDWKKLDRPSSVDRIGVHYGYAWYQVEIDSDHTKKRHLIMPDCADRATVWLNGKVLGTWGNGERASRLPMGAGFKRGRNVLTILADNMGRFNVGWRMGEAKGLYGHIHDAKPLHTGKFRLKQIETFSKKVIPRQMSGLAATLEKMPAFSAELTISLTKVTPLHLSLSDMPCHVAVVCNERTVAFFPNTRTTNFGQVTLGPELRRGKNVIRLLLWGQANAKMLDGVKFHVLSENLTQKARWSYKPWDMPQEGGLVVGKEQPAWYAAKFKRPSQSVPLFLHILGSKKGQVFLNGHNVGRFWNIGPQQHYYLPECWLTDSNELLVFEEGGHIPSGSRLEFRPLGPYRD